MATALLGWLCTALTGVDPDSLAESLRGNAEWGGPAFRAITWRKVELVHDLLLQVRPIRLRSLRRQYTHAMASSCPITLERCHILSTTADPCHLSCWAPTGTISDDTAADSVPGGRRVSRCSAATWTSRSSAIPWTRRCSGCALLPEYGVSLSNIASTKLSTATRLDCPAQANPWMRPEVDMIVAQDESVTGMFNW